MRLVSFSPQLCYTIYMNRQMLYNKIIHKISADKDFPKENLRRLFDSLPAGSREMAAAVFLLPRLSEETVSEEDIQKASALTCWLFSLFIHDDTVKNRGFSQKEAVLYGDYFIARGFSFLPAGIDDVPSLHTINHFYEKRLHRFVAPPQTDTEQITAAKEDYGIPLSDIAFYSGKTVLRDEQTVLLYRSATELLGTLWGIRCEGYPTDITDLTAAFYTAAEKTPFYTELAAMEQRTKGENIG